MKVKLVYEGFNAVLDKKIKHAMESVGLIFNGSGYFFPKNERDLCYSDKTPEKNYEAGKPSANSPIATALEVYREYGNETHGANVVSPFTRWCEQRLNTENGTSQ